MAALTVQLEMQVGFQGSVSGLVPQAKKVGEDMQVPAPRYPDFTYASETADLTTLRFLPHQILAAGRAAIYGFGQSVL